MRSERHSPLICNREHLHSFPCSRCVVQAALGLGSRQGGETRSRSFYENWTHGAALHQSCWWLCLWFVFELTTKWKLSAGRIPEKRGKWLDFCSERDVSKALWNLRYSGSGSDSSALEEAQSSKNHQNFLFVPIFSVETRKEGFSSSNNCPHTSPGQQENMH